ncbi:hypothetical protein TRVL_07127 [Trypanosoma vivax]|nr:hypothetical protein TRVL_07127 [Trypanosoma vivax]
MSDARCLSMLTNSCCRWPHTTDARDVTWRTIFLQCRTRTSMPSNTPSKVSISTCDGATEPQQHTTPNTRTNGKSRNGSVSLLEKGARNKKHRGDSLRRCSRSMQHAFVQTDVGATPQPSPLSEVFSGT